MIRTSIDFEIVHFAVLLQFRLDRAYIAGCWILIQYTEVAHRWTLDVRRALNWRRPLAKGEQNTPPVEDDSGAQAGTTSCCQGRNPPADAETDNAQAVPLTCA